jgi:SAM-dependent methyltransferase
MNQPMLDYRKDPLPAKAIAQSAALPDYLVDTYTWAYLRPRSIRLLDRHLVVNGILWGNYRRLVAWACEEFSEGDRLLQAASVYGNLSARLARRVGTRGSLDVIDIAPLQVEHCRRKLAGHGNASVQVANAAAPPRSGYDGVCCFFLLHEIPDVEKRLVVDGLLAAVRPGGIVVFVDYHRPVRWHPCRPVMATVFRWLEPYADSLLRTRIEDLATPTADVEWRLDTRFGALYQKVVARRLR